MAENYIPPRLPRPTPSNLTRMGTSPKKPACGYCKRTGHPTEQCRWKAENQPGNPSTSSNGTIPRATPAPSYGTGQSKTQTPDFFMPVPPECNVQWPPPPRSIPDPIPVPGPAPVPVPGSPVEPLPGNPTLDSQSLPVSLGCTEQCQAPSVPNNEQIPNQSLVPGPASVPVPEHAPDFHSRDPSLGPLSSPGLAPLPMPVREADPPNHSGSSPKGAASQPRA
ncbi:tetra-peptide repeat homeobox protein 1-like [Macrobrachium rosenbergii]|uniref:tetra-peptide repeat homeobox protein 1-like n=1 Tax=Macrobrachium rosenbergii TaxID=79674 RepID=UPI0034D52E9F